MSHTEQSIIDLLHNRYYNGIKYKLSNMFIFNYGETDFFVQQYKSGYCYDIEVKVSRADYFADFKKVQKHSILKEIRCDHFRPNKFFYCVPEGLITVSEVPEYAGLMYARERDVITIKEPKFIHKTVLQFEDKLCERLYHKWWQANSDNKSYKKHIEKLNKEIAELKQLQ